MDSISQLLGESEQTVIAALGSPFASVPFETARICFFKHAQVTSVEFFDGCAKRISFVKEIDGPLSYISNQRAHVRVKPCQEVDVVCATETDEVHGALLDISSVGIALQIQSRFLAPLKQMMCTNLRMMLLGTEVSIAAWVYRIDIKRKSVVLFFLGDADNPSRIAINGLIEQISPGALSRTEIESGAGESIRCTVLGDGPLSERSDSVSVPGAL